MQRLPWDPEPKRCEVCDGELYNEEVQRYGNRCQLCLDHEQCPRCEKMFDKYDLYTPDRYQGNMGPVCVDCADEFVNLLERELDYAHERATERWEDN